MSDEVKIERLVSGKDIREAFEGAMKIADEYKLDTVIELQLSPEATTYDGAVAAWSAKIFGRKG